MPLLSAVLAQNPLSGILYDNALAIDVYKSLNDWISGWMVGSLTQRVIAADLAMTCANIFAQKADPIFQQAGLNVFYPYLQKEVLCVALASIGHWRMDEPKAPLKQCLARFVPKDMVYRPKSGFVDPHGSVFYNHQFISFLREAVETNAPIVSMLHKKPLLKALDLLARKAPLPDQLLNCLWSITFLDRWYRTAL